MCDMICAGEEDPEQKALDETKEFGERVKKLMEQVSMFA